jgi:tetratricopeptide (TPR) repeat protein
LTATASSSAPDRMERAMRAAALTVTIICLVLGAWSPALAEDSLELDMAKTHYDLGTKYYQQGNYEQALDEFRKAHKLQPRPKMLFNIGRCQEALGKGEQAIASFKEYLEKVPESPNRKMVELRIKNIQRRLPGEKPAELAEPLKPEASPVPAEPEVSPEPDGEGSGVITIAGWSAVGVGVASLVTAGVMGALALGKINAYEEAHNTTHMPYSEARELLDQADSYEVAGYALLGVGVAAAAAGAALLVWDMKRGEEPVGGSGEAKVSVRPTVGGLLVQF